MVQTTDSRIMPFLDALLINPTRRSLETQHPAVDFNKPRMDASLLRREEELTSQFICIDRKVILLCLKKKSPPNWIGDAGIYTFRAS
jgi:hypothetical protein